MKDRSRILAVDDNPTNLAILEEMLRDDYEVLTAASGADALSLAGTYVPSIVLLDVMMPEMNGYETCEKLRENPLLRDSKIIMVSAKALVSERLRGYEAGADDYVTKPFEMEELLFKVRVFLKLKAVEEVDRLKTDILALLAHEVRTPLNCLIMPAEMLRSSDAMDETERRRLGEIMYQNAANLHTFFAKALSLSAMRSGKWTPVLEPVAISKIVEEASGKVAGAAAERGVAIDESVTGDHPVNADPRELVRVFTSILDNAIRFSPEGGDVSVEVGLDVHDVVVRITDQGPGIETERLPRVFDEFIGFSDGHHTSGHGLSLALAREIVDAHDGRIFAESEEGKGATFTVRVPFVTSRSQSEDGEEPHT